MRLLLDTHAFLWVSGDSGRLGRKARSAIADRDNEIFVSAAVGWEIAIKHGLGKLSLPNDPASYVPARIAALGFQALPITLQHALATAKLPPFHNDPFDRVMIAQAQLEGLTFVTADPIVAKYRLKTLPAS